MSRHLLVVGAQRCGTTYLHTMLEAHVDIAMARPSRPEPKVFCSDELSNRGRDWYLTTWFSHAAGAKLLGDKSTSYLECPGAPMRAAAMLGDPLVLVQLRDPLERAVSNWAFSSDNGYETRPLVEALSACLAEDREWDPAVTSVSPFDYLRRGRYLEQLRPWLDRFRGDVHVVFLEDLVADPDQIGTVYAALAVDQTFRPSGLGSPVNESNLAAPDLDPSLVERVRGYFADSDAGLADLLGRELPWPTALTG